MRYDLIVIGGGALGTFHAYHAAKRGLKVVVLEKDGFPSEATVRNFGQVVPSGFAPGRWHYYGRESTLEYKNIQKYEDIGIRSNGSLYVASTESEMFLLEELKRSFDEVDYNSKMLNPAEVLERSDSFKKDYVKGALFFDQEVSAHPRYMIQKIQGILKKHYTVNVVYNAAVLACEVKDGLVEVTTANGDTYIGEQTVVCNGRDFKFLYPEIFNKSDLEVSKLQMMVTPPLPKVNLKGNILTGLSIRRYESFKNCEAFKQLDMTDVEQGYIDYGIHILFKQRDDGRIVIGDSHEYADAKNSDALGFDQNMVINNLILKEAKKIVDLPSWEIEMYWSGYYSQMKNGEIFEHTIDDKIHIVTGIGGKGMTASCGYSREHIEKLFANG